MGGVYFIHCDGWIKIGASRDVAKRLQAHATGLPPSAEVYGYVESSDPFALERAAHSLWEHIRVTSASERGKRVEWFARTQQLDDWVEYQLDRLASTFDVLEWVPIDPEEVGAHIWPW